MVNRYLPNNIVLMSSAHDLDYDIQYMHTIYKYTIYLYKKYTQYIYTINILNI